MGKFVDLTGGVFGRLTVVRISSQKTKDNKYQYWCSCSCGNPDLHLKSANGLRTGNTKSCGCLQRENILKVSEGNVGTGKYYETKLKGTYRCWVNIKARCDDPNHQAYVNYGGRGITYIDKWKDFEGFLEDMGERPKGLSINRIDVNKGYSVENCEWANGARQGRDRRKSKAGITSEYKGVSYNKSAKKYKAGLMYKGVKYHIGYSGDPLELALKYDELVVKLTGGHQGTNKSLGLL